MIFNQVLEQFGDWILFWKEFQSWFFVKEVDVDSFVDRFYRYDYFMDHFERKKAGVEALLGEMGYKDLSLKTIDSKEKLISELIIVNNHIIEMNLPSYLVEHSAFISLVEQYHRNRPILRHLDGEEFLPVISSIRENQERVTVRSHQWVENKLDGYMRNLLTLTSVDYPRTLKQTLKMLFNLYADLYGTRERERDFDLFSRLPLPRGEKELEKMGRLSFPLTNDEMDEVGVVRNDKERMAFFVQENRRELKKTSSWFAILYPKELIEEKQHLNQLCYTFVEAQIMTDGHRARVLPLMMEEDPALNYPFESVVECELLKKEFLRSMKFFPEMDLNTFELGRVVYSLLQENIVAEFTFRLNQYMVALNRHLIGFWMKAQYEGENYDSIDAVMIYKFTQFTYNLLGGFFSILFLLFSRKIFRGGWWKGNVKLVSFIFHLMKEQANIRSMVHLPLLFTVFIFILFHNLIGLLPFGYTITSHILFTFFFGFSLLIGITILIWQEKGKEMIQLFLPKGVPSFLVPFLFVIEVISYLFRTVSLSVRLFANMMAGHALLHILSNFGVVISSISSPLRFFYIFPLIVVALITFLEVGIALLQAYVFTVLLAIYFNDVYSLESH